MRRVGWLVVLAACGGGEPVIPDEPWPALVIDVQVTDHIRVTAYERDRPDVCDQRLFVPPGGCDDTSDAWVCSGYVAEWINRVELRSGALDVSTTGWHDFGQAWFGRDEIAGLHALTVTLVAVDGQEATIAIPDVERPEPAIDALDYDGALVRIDWSAQPAAASALAEVYNGFVGRRCHVRAAQRAELDWPATLNSPAFPTGYAVTSFAPATAVTTPLGEATLWMGATHRADLPVE